MDNELSGESEQILAHRLKQCRDQDHGQVMGGHLVHLREHLDSEEETSHLTINAMMFISTYDKYNSKKIAPPSRSYT